MQPSLTGAEWEELAGLPEYRATVAAYGLKACCLTDGDDLRQFIALAAVTFESDVPLFAAVKTAATATKLEENASRTVFQLEWGTCSTLVTKDTDATLTLLRQAGQVVPLIRRYVPYVPAVLEYRGWYSRGDWYRRGKVTPAQLAALPNEAEAACDEILVAASKCLADGCTPAACAAYDAARAATAGTPRHLRWPPGQYLARTARACAAHVRVTLFEHQVLASAWALWREECCDLVEAVHAWAQCTAANHEASRALQADAAQYGGKLTGGFMAGPMGAGKTVQAIGLMVSAAAVASSPPAGQPFSATAAAAAEAATAAAAAAAAALPGPDCQLEQGQDFVRRFYAAVLASAGGRVCSTSLLEDQVAGRRAVWDMPAPAALQTAAGSLVIVPASLLGQWATELAAKWPSAKVVVCAGPAPKRSGGGAAAAAAAALQLHTADVVLTTYDTVTSEERRAATERLARLADRTPWRCSGRYVMVPLEEGVDPAPAPEGGVGAVFQTTASSVCVTCRGSYSAGMYFVVYAPSSRAGWWLGVSVASTSSGYREGVFSSHHVEVWGIHTKWEPYKLVRCWREHPAGESACSSCHRNFAWEWGEDPVVRIGWPARLAALAWPRIIMDESHCATDTAQKLGEALRTLRTRTRWFLTATPAGSLSSLTGQLRLLRAYEPTTARSRGRDQSIWDSVLAEDTHLKGGPNSTCWKWVVGPLMFRNSGAAMLSGLLPAAHHALPVTPTPEEEAAYGAVLAPAVAQADTLAWFWGVEASGVVQSARSVSCVGLPGGASAAAAPAQSDDPDGVVTCTVCGATEGRQGLPAPFECGAHAACFACLEELLAGEADPVCGVCEAVVTPAARTAVRQRTLAELEAAEALEVEEADKEDAPFSLGRWSAGSSKVGALAGWIATAGAGPTLVFVNSSKLVVPLVRCFGGVGDRRPVFGFAGSVEERAAQLKAFGEAGPQALMFAPIRSAACGLNLAFVKRVVFLDVPPTQVLETQAVGRARRFGATGQVHVWHAYHTGWVEERLCLLRQAAAAVPSAGPSAGPPAGPCRRGRRGVVVEDRSRRSEQVQGQEVRFLLLGAAVEEERKEQPAAEDEEEDEEEEEEEDEEEEPSD